MSTSMANHGASNRGAASPPTPRSVAGVLADLRRRIRWYVVIEGIAMVIISLVVAFWIGLACDYVPVLLGAGEMPRGARIALLVAILGVAATIGYQYILVRCLRPLRDSSLALLVERQFPSLRDALITTVEAKELGRGGEPTSGARPLQGSSTQPDEFELQAIAESTLPPNQEMLRQTMSQAQTSVAQIELAKIFSYRPLATKIGGALLGLASLVLLGVAGGNLLPIAVSRLLVLSDAPWPRRTQIELLGFEQGEKTVAKGSDLIVRVRADATRDTPPPDVCTILYRTEDGNRGRVNMSRDGEPRDGYQHFVFNGKPFKGILSDMTLDVIGFDHRLRDQRVRVVLSPVVVGVRLRSELPAYTGLVPREEQWTPGVQLPMGSRIQATVQTSKPLRSAEAKNLDTGEVVTWDFASTETQSNATNVVDSLHATPADATEFSYQIEALDGRHAVSISLRDTDGIDSAEPYLLTIGAVEDAVPRVDITLRGIGNAITPIARLAVEGTVEDDYQLAETWFDIQLEDAHHKFVFAPAASGTLDEALDLRDQSRADNEPLVLQPDQRILLSIKAQDKFDLGNEPHVGSSESIALNVVRPDELLAILDAHELELRRRLEQTRSEMSDSRDSLARLRASFREASDTASNSGDPEATADGSGESDTETDAGDGLDDESSAEDDGTTASGARGDSLREQRNWAELRQRWTQWTTQKSEQTVLEIAGLADAIERIRDELINNRVDTPERQSRLELQLVKPLRNIAQQQFPEYQQGLERLSTLLTAADPAAEPLVVEVVGQADAILDAIDRVLEKMLELEDYAELVNIIRGIIQQQDELLEKTKDEQKRRVLDFLK